MGKKGKKASKQAGRPIDDGDSHAPARRTWVTADSDDEPGVAVNVLHATTADSGS